MNFPILITGATGLVGSRLCELLGGKYEFIPMGFATGVNITDPQKVLSFMEASHARTVVHLAARTDVDECEDEKYLGEDGETWLVNVVGTDNIVEAAGKTGKRLIHISTDFVFDGQQESYSENDEPNPVNWYGISKTEAETIVLKKDISSVILRISYPYRAFFPTKKDFVRRILEKLKKGETVRCVTDHIFTPTFIDDIARAIDVFLGNELTGIYHVVGSQSLSVYDAAREIADVFKFGGNIEKTTRLEYFREKAFRPFKLALKNDKIAQLGISMKGFHEGLVEFKRQVETMDYS